MTSDDFWKLYNDRELNQLLPIIHKSKKFGFDLKHYTEQASWSTNYEELYFLWKLNAKAYTPFIEEIFNRFEKGEYEKMIIEKKLEEQKKADSIKADLTEFSSVNQIPLGEISLSKGKDSIIRLTIPILPFHYDNFISEEELIVFSDLEINFDDLKKGRIDFNKNQFDESIYLFYTHNPVVLKSIEFEDYSIDFLKIRITIQFYFSVENNGDDELLIIKETVPNFLIS